MMILRRWLPAFVALLLIGGMNACGKKESATTVKPAIENLVPRETLVRGEQLYRQHCMQCHGPEGQGHPDWQTPGIFAAPPLNGTGNDWKRSQHDFMAVIKQGVKRKDQDVMPGWKGRLTDSQINDIITWFQTFWPREVYERWQKANVAPAPRKS